MKKKNIVLLTIIICIQIIIQIICGSLKQYYHMDEAYSLGLANYNSVGIQDSADFYDNWHNTEYYEDYLAVQDKDKGNYKPVYENQKNDVHPPFYYLLLRLFMNFNINYFSKWPGIILNIIIYIFITIFTYLTLKRILKNDKASIIIAGISSITMASLTTAIYIRMYALSTLNVLITLYLHFRLYEGKDKKQVIFPLIGLSALIGSLTHYHYIIFLAVLYIMFMYKFIKEKNYKNCIIYTITMLISAVGSLLIFPYSINHIFFGYRGQGSLSKLTKIKEFIGCINGYLGKINRFTFNNTLILLAILLIIIYIIKIKKKINFKVNEYTKYMVAPTLVYFIMIALSSPWIELRYIMPICPIIFSIIICWIYNIMKLIFSEKNNKIFTVIILLVILIMPIITKVEPEVEYSDKKEIVNFIKQNANKPVIFLFDENHNRFLDDIYLFTIAKNSYIAKNFDCTKDNVMTILDKQNISNGIIIFINEGYENDEQIQAISNATNLKNITHIQRLNACDVYEVK